VIRIVVVAAEDGGWHRAKRLVNDGLYAVSRYDRPLGRALDILGGNNFLCHDNQPAPRLGLLLVLPVRAVDLAIPLRVRDLDMDQLAEVRNLWQFYRDRRPDQYGSLVQP